MGTRLTDWRQRLECVIDDYRGRGLEYGTTDCFTLTADALEAVRGSWGGPWWKHRRDLYADRHMAEVVIRHNGGLVRTARRAFGLHERKPMRLAVAGDIVVLRGPDGPSLGVSVGRRVAALHPVHGLVFLRPEECICAFDV